MSDRATPLFIPIPEGTLPQRLINPLFAYIEAALSASPMLILLQALGAAAASRFGTMDDSFKILCAAMALDLMMGIGAALRRNQFSLRSLWEGLVAKLMVATLCGTIAWAAPLVPGLIFVSKLLNFGFAIIEVGSVFRSFRRGRVKYPIWVQQASARAEAIVTEQVKNQLGIKGKE